jgi:hypothetical protein
MRVRLVHDPETYGALCHDLRITPVPPGRRPYRYAGVIVLVPAIRRRAGQSLRRPVGSVLPNSRPPVPPLPISGHAP